MQLRLLDACEVGVSGAEAGLDIELRLEPRRWTAQQVTYWQLATEPVGQPRQTSHDDFGNAVTRIAVNQRDLRLRITSIAEIAVDSAASPPAPPVTLPETDEGELTRPDAALSGYAHAVARGCRDEPVAIMAALARAVARDLRYDAAATDAATPAAQAFRRGAGVCQDFAQVTIAAARALGLPAYYIGGYRVPGRLPDGQAPVAIVRHAWVGLMLGPGEARAFDPADPLSDDVRVAVACGRDFADARPLRIRGRGATFRRFAAQAQAEPI